MSDDDVTTPTDRDLEALQRARIARGWSLSDAATRLHISSAQVDALERGDFAALPGTAFARGYLKNYARLLNLDPEPLLAEYDRRSGGEALRATLQVLPRTEGPLLDYGRWVTLASIAIAVLLVIAFVWFWGDQEATATHSATQETASVSPAAPVALSVPATVSAQSVSPLVTMSTTSAARSAAATATTQSTELVDQGLLLTFTGPCWVQVRDGSGHIVWSQLSQAGQQAHITAGTPPYAILVGKASAIHIQYQGKVVPLPVNDLGVARLRVGQAPVAAATSVSTVSHPVAPALSSAPTRSVHHGAVLPAQPAVVLPTSPVTSEVSHAS